MTDLREKLEQLAMSQYLETLVAEGFDAWETILDITESDLNSLNISLGHRRKLQRAIAEWRGHAHNYCPRIALNHTNIPGSFRDGDCPHRTASSSTKRKYRRHPKPDEHAPERPRTAYVMFSDDVRRSVRNQGLTFAEIAKVVGRRWQNSPAKAQETYRRQAHNAKEKHDVKMAEYKKSPEYHSYQSYLEEFKTKHTLSRKEDLRSRSGTQTSTLTRSSIFDYGGRSSSSVISSDESLPIEIGHNQEERSYPSEAVSPATHSFTGLPSLRVTDPGSPVSASACSAALHQRGGPLFLTFNAPESSHGLLPSVQSFDLAPSTIHRLAQFSSPTQRPLAIHPLSSFEALIRVGELARIAHEATEMASPA